MTPGADRHWAQVQEEPCEECGFDPLGTDPADLPGAVRGLSRRFRAPLTRFLPGEDPSVIVRARPEPTTWSALEYTCHTRGALALFDRRIRLALEEDDPVLEWWDHEAAAVDEAYNAEDPVAAADGLAAAAEGLAATLASVPPDAWDRTARRGEDRFTVVGMGRYALHEGHHHLLDVGRVLRAARGR